MIFDKDIAIKEKAMNTFVNTFGGSFKKLDPLDVDYKIFNKDHALIAYAVVVPVPRMIKDSYPIPVEAKKAVKLIDKRLAPVIIWACENGIIYGKANKIRGDVKWSKITTNDTSELIIYYDKQKELKYVRYS
jgi:hypothetical protein